MPPKPKRPCKHIRCPNTTSIGHGYCDAHKDEAFNRLRQSATRERISEKNGFYSSRAWRMLRTEFIRSNPFCCVCDNLATVADHILPRRLNPELALDPNNLQPLCAPCHARKTGKEIRYRQLAIE